MELTDPNGPSGLTILSFKATLETGTALHRYKPLFDPPLWGGDSSEEATPVPIPNTVVKLLSADAPA